MKAKLRLNRVATYRKADRPWWSRDTWISTSRSWNIFHSTVELRRHRRLFWQDFGKTRVFRVVSLRKTIVLAKEWKGVQRIPGETPAWLDGFMIRWVVENVRRVTTRDSRGSRKGVGGMWKLDQGWRKTKTDVHQSRPKYDSLYFKTFLLTTTRRSNWRHLWLSRRRTFDQLGQNFRSSRRHPNPEFEAPFPSPSLFEATCPDNYDK